MLSIVFYFLFSFANAYQISRVNDRLIISSDKCQESLEIIKSLNDWKETTSEPNQCHFDQIRLQNENKSACEIDFTECVPKHVAQYAQTMAAKSGPNCFNLALVLKGILPALRYVPPNEISFYMQEPLCKQIAKNQSLNAGDIGIIRSESSKNFAHAFIYISEKLSYQKKGVHYNEPFELKATSKIFQDEQINPDCGKLNYDEKQCAWAAVYFRCQSMEQYLEKNKKWPDEILQSLDSLNKYDACAEKHTIKKELLSDVAISSLLETTKTLAFYLKNQSELIQKKQDDKEKIFVLGYLQLRLAAIVESLKSSGHQNYSELKLLNDQIRESSKSTEFN